jgi:hypothetical protein
VNRETPPGPEGKNPTRQAAVETKRKSGPVKRIVINGEPVKLPPDRDWSAQREAIRRINSIQIGFLEEASLNGSLLSVEQQNTLQRCASIVKQLAADARADNSDDDLTDEDLEVIAARDE